MSTHHNDDLVITTLNGCLDDVTMRTPVDEIIATGKSRRRRRRLASGAIGGVAATALALGLPALDHSTDGSGSSALSTGNGSAHISTVAFRLDKHSDGTIHVTWDKEQYFKNHDGLQKALRAAGFPVLIKEGQFCAGAQDDVTLDPSGAGPGVREVVKGQRRSDGGVDLVFTPSAMPAGKQLFIGYLSAAQLAITHGRPGSVERLISIGVPLTCTTQAPPPGPPRSDAAPEAVKPG